jgi:hypothetical protein
MSMTVSSPSIGEQGSPLKFPAPSSLPTLDPRQARTLLNLNIMRLIFSSPTRLTDNGKIELDLAEWIKGEGTQYIITLRNMYWPDGSLLTTDPIHLSSLGYIDPRG